jgi:glucose-6-phosphate 1-epimerase
MSGNGIRVVLPYKFAVQTWSGCTTQTTMSGNGIHAVLTNKFALQTWNGYTTQTSMSEKRHPYMAMALLEDFMAKNSFSQAAGNGGLQKIVVAHGSGSSLEVYLQGAAVTSWKDSKGAECLYVSPKSFFDTEHPVRGGIPLAFPQVGPGDLPLHGFARLAEWSVLSQETLKDGSAALTLTLADSAYTRGLWDFAFLLEYTLILNETLTTQLAVKNTGSAPFAFNVLFHTYFRVGDIAKAELMGLAGAKALDRVENKEFTPGDSIVFHTAQKETNCLLQNTFDAVRLKDGAEKRVYAITRSRNLSETVYWNPWAENCAKGADFADDSYKFFACIEPGAVQEKVQLVPGASAVFSQTLAVE